METPPVLCTFGWRVAELSLARSEAVGLRLIHQPGPDQRLFHFDKAMIHPYAVLGFLVFCAAAAWTMALIVWALPMPPLDGLRPSAFLRRSDA
jgi:hypothetical protein